MSSCPLLETESGIGSWAQSSFGRTDVRKEAESVAKNELLHRTDVGDIEKTGMIRSVVLA